MRRLLFFLVLLLLLSGCGPARQDRKAVGLEPVEKIKYLIQAENFVAAATEYLYLAKNDKQNSTVYRLKAVTMHLKSNQYALADKVLKETSIAADAPIQQVTFDILSAQVQFQLGEVESALAKLKAVPVKLIPSHLRIDYYTVLALASLTKNDYLTAASARLELLELSRSSYKANENIKLLWATFQAMPENQLNKLRSIAPAALSSWFELAIIATNYRYNSDKLSQVLDGWQQRYPTHPANEFILKQLLDQSKQLVQQPSKIGLLLPLSGKYEKPSAAIRDGFLAAWYLDGKRKTGGHSEIKIYDANTLNIKAAYEQAVSDGVEFIIGPLEKDAIKQLRQLETLPVQVLALNSNDARMAERKNAKPNLIQFALSPEEEAAQIAEAAAAVGHEKVLVISPNTPWGNRIANAFKTRWLALGGKILEQGHFAEQGKDFKSPVKALLNIDSSLTRSKELRRKLKLNLHSVERRREDTDFIFAVATPTDGRQLLPQFKFHHGGDIPVYSTSHIFTGIQHEAKDVDMEGVRFIDMPWVLDSARQFSLIQDNLNRNWQQDKSPLKRLYAFGIDAYHLISQIKRLAAEQTDFFDGETGILTIDDNNIVRRRLRLAHFVDGKPVLLN